MICYKDTTFCVSPCGTKDCERKISGEIIDGARAWWGGDNAPLAVALFARNCTAHTPSTEPDEQPLADGLE